MKQNFKSRGRHLQKFFIAVGLILAFIQPLYAENLNSAIGFWKTKDPKTGKFSSIVHIYKDPNSNLLGGRIYKIFAEGKHKVTDHCPKCPGEQKNKPMLGLKIIRDMKDVGNGYYKGGHVLDPRDGSEYHAKMHVIDNGQLLKLRGYIGFSLFGKTTQWVRVTPGQA